MDADPKSDQIKSVESVSKTELNAWRRGFTPQAEIWNGRMAILGLILFLVFVLNSNFLFGS
tara:strand:+ start:1632 stop:1814 length:183 start_codon:yes stop_codon:yes gene_type:complete